MYNLYTESFTNRRVTYQRYLLFPLASGEYDRTFIPRSELTRLLLYMLEPGSSNFKIEVSAGTYYVVELIEPQI